MALWESLSEAEREDELDLSDDQRAQLDRRYDDLKSGRVQPIDGDEARARLSSRSAARRAGPR